MNNFSNNYVQLQHNIYSRLISYLEQRQIRSKKTGNTLQYIFHETANISDKQNLEAEILDFAEFSALDYEVLRYVPNSLFYELKQQGETQIIAENRIVGIPNFILNACVCEALLREFPIDDLVACNGFILREGCIRLDVDETYVRKGFMMPFYKNGLIAGLKVFRYPNDNRPFILKSRTSASGGDNG